VYGVNHDQYSGENGGIFTAASCTTNAIVPVIKVVKDTLGIERGHIETVHAYTNDQNLLDNYHKKARRGRSAPNNMVITETGAGKAVTKIYPEMKGILTSNAVRVPVQNVSLAILSLRVSKKTTVDEVNAMLKNASLYGDLVEQIDYSMSTELVSSDVVGNPQACEIDSNATIVSDDGLNIVIYAWYDNEYGYTNQVVRLAKHLAGVRRLIYY
jgi:glyceraldehyde 3-phosphate dehydrogenase